MIDLNSMDLNKALALYKTNMGDNVDAIPVQDFIDFVANRVRATIGNGFAPPRYIPDEQMVNNKQATRLLVEVNDNGILFTAHADILGAAGNDLSFQLVGGTGDNALSCALHETDPLCLVIQLETLNGEIMTDFDTLFAFLNADPVALSLFSFTDIIIDGSAVLTETSKYLEDGTTSPSGYIGELVMGDSYGYILTEVHKGAATTWKKFDLSAIE